MKHSKTTRTGAQTLLVFLIILLLSAHAYAQALTDIYVLKDLTVSPPVVKAGEALNLTITVEKVGIPTQPIHLMNVEITLEDLSGSPLEPFPVPVDMTSTALNDPYVATIPVYPQDWNLPQNTVLSLTVNIVDKTNPPSETLTANNGPLHGVFKYTGTPSTVSIPEIPWTLGMLLGLLALGIAWKQRARSR